MADDRRIITGTHVVAKEGSLLEDGTTRKWKIDDTVNKTLGGKSIVDITATQNWSGGDFSGWYQGDNKSTELSVNSVTKADTTDGTENVKFLYVRNLDTTQNCYISLTTATTWNGTWASDIDAGGWITSGLATTDYGERSPSYSGDWDEGMYITVPAGGSVQLRGDSTGGLDMEHVRFRNSGSTAINIEYVLAE